MSWGLYPVSLLFRSVVWVRKLCYGKNLISSWRSPVPIVVVGNITVGGAGKTPLIIALSECLKGRGLKVGIVTRGYGGSKIQQPVKVDASSSAKAVGDEAVMLAQRTSLPVVTCANRVQSVQHLLSLADLDLVLCDDGLQHYALQRDLEIAVIDSEYVFGNGFCLPAGPLREPVSRLASIDLVVHSGNQPRKSGYTLQGTEIVSLHGIHETRSLESLKGQTVHAVAGIAAPERFFAFLRAQGLLVVPHPFADHAVFQPSDLTFSDALPVLMTEKDKVKCVGFELVNSWYVPVTAQLDDTILREFNHLVDHLLSENTNADK